MPPKTDVVRGTLDLLILKSLSTGRLHGLGVARRIRQLTGDTFEVGAGSLFPALHRLEESGWLRAEWGDSENNRRAKYYELTPAGRRRLKSQTDEWARVSAALARALGLA